MVTPQEDSWMAGCDAAQLLALRQLEGQERSGVEIDTLPSDGQVKMGSGGPARASAQTELLSACNPLPLLDPGF